MPHDTPLIATIVAGLGLAFIFGALANRFKVPPLVGYLVAGVLVGPNTPGFVADQELALELAEIGVILLMFGVGLHFSLKDLLSVRAIAVPGAIVQIAFATALGAGLAWMLGWSIGAGLVFGLALSVASTVVLLRALQERRMIETERGRIAVGWLIVEDLAMVLALVLLPALAGVLGGEAQTTQAPDILALRFDFGIWGVIGITLAKVAAFVVVMMVVGRRVIPWILHYVAHTGSRELFRLSVLAIALGVAFGAAKLFGVSLALGAFFAGMIMSESELSHQAAEETLPLRDAFSVLFFVSVGMLFDPTSLLSNTWPILATLFIIIIGKSVAAFLIVVAFGYPVATALIISASLAQIGEFSFILAELGVGLGLLPEKGRDLILAGAILSIVLNPLVFAGVARLKPWLEKRSGKVPESVEAVPIGPATEPGEVATITQVASAKVDDDIPPPTKLTDHTILIGYGRVGSLVGQSLKDAQLPFLVIEDSDKTIARLMAEGVETVAGNAVKGEVFGAANAAGARRLILAIPNAFEAGQIVLKAKAANPAMLIIARAHSDAEVEHLTGLGADKVIMGEREIARGIVEQILEGSARPPTSDPEPDAPPAAA
ncbi:CPA2 family monovalent cation:H+ antiporter-2 [Aminobacter lissarensis]|uniref:CPA2 family monovalent cation:H+ antiporter-2 n=1 Tax=Aminobacter carboxidus TaxID=376165 RepID=A0A8E1WFJ2_9HYPH|nr:cation:proton antiporter [Aminobacter lissarensis]MBB6467522.1 CPA2 family monovalent cation:H+ antiporter-2 [Aminobacter lissarensis]